MGSFIVYAAGAKAHHANHRVILSSEPNVPQVFHWMNTVISPAKPWMDGTYHGRGRPSEVPDGNGIWKSLRIDLIVGTWEPGSPTAYSWRVIVSAGVFQSSGPPNLMLPAPRTKLRPSQTTS